MKVTELINNLKKLPLNAQVEILYDGACRGDVLAVYEANGGQVVVAGDMPVYSWEDQPKEKGPSQ